MATKVKEQDEAQEAQTESHDGPLLDLSDAAVKKMLKAAKKRGFVTYEELNQVLPSEEVTSEQIEDILSMLSEQGINVIENEEHDDGEEKTAAKTGEPNSEPAPSQAVAETKTTAVA
ncbi:MAG: RNA polymerase sigma factor region1.1 domain-containing protein, partial [Alphaproteobacteria bacterium]